MSQLISSLMAQIIYLFYIGSKPAKTDTITDTRIVWNGFGDKQPVPADKAAILLRHPDVWVTEEQFNAGVKSGKYKKRNFVNLDVDPHADDIDLDEVFEEDENSEGEGGDDSSGDDAATILRIQEAILATAAEKKPSIDSIRSALPGLSITAKQLNQAWKELNGASED